MAGEEGARRRLGAIAAHIQGGAGDAREGEVLLSLAACSGRRDCRTMFARQAAEEGATFMRCQTKSVVDYQAISHSRVSAPPKYAAPSATVSQGPHNHPHRQASSTASPQYARPAALAASQLSALATPEQEQLGHLPLFAKPAPRASPKVSKPQSSEPKKTKPSVRQRLLDESPPAFAKPGAVQSRAVQHNDEKFLLGNVPGWTPRMDVVESVTAYMASVELPGVSPESIRVEITDTWLLVSGERKDNRWLETEDPKYACSGGNAVYHRREQPHGPYRAKWRLPRDVVARSAVAVFSDGVLCIQLLKAGNIEGGY